MLSFGTYPIEVVHAAMLEGRGKKASLPDGRTFNRTSHRLVLFSTKGVTCSACGLAGSYYRLESHGKDITPHLNLYAVSAAGKPILMTKDHTHPKSKGGKNELENYTTMCQPCNSAKADKLTDQA